MKRAGPPRAIVFDFDGTLLDSLPVVLRAFSHALQPFSSEFTMDILTTLGGPPERTLPELLGGRKNLAEALRRLAAFNREHHHLIQPFPGLRAVLQQLREQKIALAIWTGRDRASTEELLASHRLKKFFATMVCGDDLPTHKPDGGGLREILQQLEVASTDAIMVGDSIVDVLGAHECGVDALLITHGRDFKPAIVSKCRQMVASPLSAYQLLLSGGPPPRVSRARAKS